MRKQFWEHLKIRWENVPTLQLPPTFSSLKKSVKKYFRYCCSYGETNSFLILPFPRAWVSDGAKASKEVRKYLVIETEYFRIFLATYQRVREEKLEEPGVGSKPQCINPPCCPSYKIKSHKFIRIACKFSLFLTCEHDLSFMLKLTWCVGQSNSGIN